MQDRVRIAAFGNVLDYDPRAKDLRGVLRIIEAYARNLGARNVLWQRLANDDHKNERGAVECYESLHWSPETFGRMRDKRCDGILLQRPGDAVAFTTRDCPVLTLYSEHGGPIVVLHCSRSSLQGIDLSGNLHQSVIRNALSLCRESFADKKSVHGFLNLGIAAKHSPNEGCQKIIERLSKTWPGSGVIGKNNGRPTLDLVALAKAQVKEYGSLKPEQIVHDGLDTFSDTRLASEHANRGGYNLTIVIYPYR